VSGSGQPDDSGGALKSEAGRRAGAKPEALELTYRYINRRERTVAEVREHLARSGVEPGPAQEAIDELLATGALDDARFARLFVEDKRTLEQWGSDRIRRGLAARGIERELIETALTDQAGDDLDSAVALLGRRFPAPPRERRERERALGVLVRKGYEYELAAEALAKHCSAYE
jgi:regulatory protein